MAGVTAQQIGAEWTDTTVPADNNTYVITNESSTQIVVHPTDDDNPPTTNVGVSVPPQGRFYGGGATGRIWARTIGPDRTPVGGAQGASITFTLER